MSAPQESIVITPDLSEKDREESSDEIVSSPRVSFQNFQNFEMPKEKPKIKYYTKIGTL
jgi:hypothetical protein